MIERQAPLSHTALARKHRPRRFEDVAVQEHVSETLRRAVPQPAKRPVAPMAVDVNDHARLRSRIFCMFFQKMVSR